MDDHVLDIQGARFRYGQRQVLDGTSLRIRSGEVYVLLGPNGAGKSTLVRAISGRIDLDAGSLRVTGEDPVRSAAARRAIGLVPQQIALYEKLTPKENLSVIGRMMGVRTKDLPSRIDTALVQIELAERTHDRVEVLSGGMRRRVNIAAALVHRPRLLILDEPTVGVDQAGRRALRDLLMKLRESGLAILLTTHEMDEAEALADRVGVLIGGRIVAEGHVEALMKLHFGDRIELSVKPGGQDAKSEAGAALAAMLSQPGLVLDTSTGQWRGLVEPGAPPVRDLLDKLTSGELAVSDVRMRRPGLDTLMGKMLSREGAT